MTIWKQELRQGLLSLLIWTGSIGFLVVICVLLFPEMQGQMNQVSDMFASMGSFTQAFGMDRLNFGELIGFYGVECGNILGLGGAFYAALTAITALSKEERDHTAEFLLAHPVRRSAVVLQKLLAVLTQILLLNLATLLLSVISIRLIGEEIPWKPLLLLHLAYLLLQLELAAICFGVSAFLRRGGLGLGIGLAAICYFLNIVANIAEQAEWLKYITPYGYAEAADIVSSGSIDFVMALPGLGFAVLGIAAAFFWYTRKDIL